MVRVLYNRPQGALLHSELHGRHRCIADMIQAWGDFSPQATALTAPGRAALTFEGLYAQVAYVACTLHALGITRNDRVAIVLPNGPEMAAAFLGVAAGATAAPLNPTYRAEEFDFYLGDLNTKALIVQENVESAAREIAESRDIPIIHLSPNPNDAAGLFTLNGNRPDGEERGQFAEPDDVALVLHTSGTTARPKIVPLTHINLCTSAGNIQGMLELVSSDRCLNVMPLFHIHGLVGVLLSSLRAGASVICSPGCQAPVFFDWVDECQPTWYSAVPSMHQAILVRAEQNREIVKRHTLRFIRSSSSSLPPQMMQQMENVYGVPVIESYGMTEAAHQMTSNPLPPGARKAGSVGLAAGPEVAIMNEEGTLLPVKETGEVVIRGKNVTVGYENNPEANANAFVDGWFRTGDQGAIDEEGYLYLTGRLKEIINRGGEKISPREIDEVLMDHPAVFQAVTFAVPDDRLGEDVAVAVVLEPGAEAGDTELRVFIAEHVADFKVPREVVILEEIPKGPTGKLQRIGLAEKLGLTLSSNSAVGAEKEFVAPRTPVEEKLASIWSNVLRVERVGIHDDYFRLGGDSMLAAQILSRIRDAFHTELSFLVFFEDPTVASMAKCIETAGKTSKTLTFSPIKPATRDRELPLSFAQEQMWFMQQLISGSPVYNNPVAVFLKGRLDVAVLERSIEEIVTRHQALRTTFPVTEGRPFQSVAPHLALSLPVSDISDLPESERESEAHRLASEEVRRPFDLAHGPVFRGKLIRVGKEDHRLILTMHHIVSDGWTKTILVRELSVLYQAFAAGKPSPLPGLAIQYPDFAVWQREGLDGKAIDDELSYWKEKLAGATPVLQLPADHARPAVQTFQGATQSVALPQPLWEAIQSFSREEKVSRFMTLLAAFQALLHRYAQQDDICVACPVAGRTRAETEELIGCFTNTLVMRTDVGGNPTFRELLTRVRKVALEAYDHQEVPFEKLVEALQPERSLSHSPLAQVAFVLEDALVPPFDHPDLTLTVVEMDTGTSKFDLSLSFMEGAGSLTATLEYSTDLFDGSTIERLWSHYQTLLESVVADPDQRLSEVSILTQGERQQLLAEWNSTETDYSRDSCIHQIFECQVERSPDALAVVFEDQRLTYRELNIRANQMAHYLLKRGVGPDVLVGVHLERSVEMLVAVLGTLKAGGAYVPLDPEFPEERIDFMLEDSGAEVLLTQEHLKKRVTSPTVRVVLLDAEWDAISSEGLQDPEMVAGSENLAYVIYTSGSSGKPKGVQIPHGAVVNFLESMREEPGLTENDVLLSVTTLSFDIAVLELFLPMIVGARLVLAGSEDVSDGKRLMALQKRSGATVMQATPATWQLLLASGWKGKMDLKILCGGEALSRELANELLERCDDLWNMYGPTETTIWSTVHRVVGGQTGPVLIGRPIANTQIYILDKDMRPVPVGVPGELYIGGGGLARGYLNRPELNAEKYVSHPFSDQPNARVFNTGDLARFRPDGNIEFLGRIDDQVKIRGFRIEPGEIGAVLSLHPGVRESAVLAREDVPGEKRLAAYYAPEQDASPTTSELLQYLRGKLPEYMVPSAFVELETMPLTPSGKIDRRALPKPDGRRPELETIFTPPKTEVELKIAAIWKEALSLKNVGTEDNFFDLGGHSLRLVEVHGRLSDSFQAELSMVDMFRYPTIKTIAAFLSQEVSEQAFTRQIDDSIEKLAEGKQRLRKLQQRRRRASSNNITRRRESGPVPLGYAQERLWFMSQLLPDSPVYNNPVAVRLSGPLNVTSLEQALNEIMRRHEALRTNFRALDGQSLQYIVPSLSITLPASDIADLPGARREAEAQRLVTEQIKTRFSLEHGPLVRAKLIKLEAEEHILVVTMHHIISDGWSKDIFFRELSALYHAFSTGSPCPLSELSIQYVDFTVWQRLWLEGETTDDQVSYWKEKLHGVPSVIELPTDRPRPAVQTFQGARRSFALSKPLWEKIKVLSGRERTTQFMLLLAAFQTLLHRYTGQEDIAVGCPIAGRNQHETEELIGCFTNTLVMRIDLSGNPTFRELLSRVRTMALEAYDHQELPFDRLVEELHPERNLSHSPLFQVMFAYQKALRPTFEHTDLTVSLVDVDTGTAKFDLSLSLEEETERLFGTLEYNTDLFDEATMERLWDHYQTLLEGVVADQGRHISELPLLTSAERHQLLVEWNETRSDYPGDRCIHELFEAQVERTPDKTAVECEGQRLSFRELNTRANQLAHYLIDRGVGPNVLVGVFIECSAEMVVGLLGILKAGGAYMPLDPTFPEERIRFMLEDSSAEIVLVNKQSRSNRQSVFSRGCGIRRDTSAIHLRPDLRRGVGATPGHVDNRRCVVCLDSDWEMIARKNGQNPVNKATAENLIYVIYTSGSTGNPNGVEIQHAALVNLSTWHQRAYSVTTADRAPLLAALSFDASVWELWPYLTCGASIHIPSEANRMEPTNLVKWLADQRLTICFLPTPLAELVLAQEWPEALELRVLLTGGDKLRQYPRQSLPFRLVNHYGPTENTVVSTCTDIPGETESNTPPPIGRPISNTKVYLLDHSHRPVPIGAPGEIYVAGAGIARGYRNRPDLTRERFISNPFDNEEAAILYRTGDSARYLPNGNIEFLGRNDDQVKVRGFRIELGEIAAILDAHPAVRESVVMAREDRPGDPSTPLGTGKRLVAYFVSKQDTCPTTSELLQYVREKLPKYMVPSAFVKLETMPLTPSGKLDRRALPAPDRHRPELETRYAPPHTEVELTITAIWQEVLSLEKVGTEDNFFDLGGHSLRLVEVRSRLRDVFQKELSMIDMFKYPTVKALAAYLSQEDSEQAPSRQRDDSMTKLHEGKNRLKQLQQRRRQAVDRR